MRVVKGFSNDAPVAPLPVAGLGRSHLLMYRVRTDEMARLGEGCRIPCGRAAEAVGLGEDFPCEPLLLCFSLTTSELDVVRVPLPVVDETSKEVVSPAILSTV